MPRKRKDDNNERNDDAVRLRTSVTRETRNVQLLLLFIDFQGRSILRLARACLLRRSWQSRAAVSSAHVKYRMAWESMTRSTERTLDQRHACDELLAAMQLTGPRAEECSGLVGSAERSAESDDSEDFYRVVFARRRGQEDETIAADEIQLQERGTQ